MKHEEIFEVNLNDAEIRQALIQYVRNKYCLQIPKGECKIKASAFYSMQTDSMHGYVHFHRDLTLPMPPAEQADPGPHAPSANVSPDVTDDS